MTATREQIYSDYLDNIITNYNKEIGKDPNGLAIMRGRLQDKNFDKKVTEQFREQLDKLFQEYSSQEGAES